MHCRTLQYGFSVKRSAPRGEVEDNSCGDLSDTCTAAVEYGIGNAGGDLKSGIPSGIKLLSVSVGLLRRIGAANNIGHSRESLSMSAGVSDSAHYSYFTALPRLGRSRGSLRLPRLRPHRN